VVFFMKKFACNWFNPILVGSFWRRHLRRKNFNPPSVLFLDNTSCDDNNVVLRPKKIQL
jgi:hypothetical protein